MVRKTIVREVKTLRALQHENIVRLKEAFKRKGKLYMVFEFLERNLLEVLDDTPQGLHPSAVKSYIYQLIKSLAFCHGRGFIHRDIKPENLLISRNADPHLEGLPGLSAGILKLCDFGFARPLTADVEGLTDYVSTRWYRAPELLVGINYSFPVDVWAIGCIMGELADGRPLFPGESDIDQLYVIQKVLGRLPEMMVTGFANNARYRGLPMPTANPDEGLTDKYEHLLGFDAVHLMSLLLQVDPAQRPTAESALQHPYFDSIHASQALNQRRPSLTAQALAEENAAEAAAAAAAASLAQAQAEAKARERELAERREVERAREEEERREADRRAAKRREAEKREMERREMEMRAHAQALAQQAHAQTATIAAAATAAAAHSSKPSSSQHSTFRHPARTTAKDDTSTTGHRGDSRGYDRDYSGEVSSVGVVYGAEGDALYGGGTSRLSSARHRAAESSDRAETMFGGRPPVAPGMTGPSGSSERGNPLMNAAGQAKARKRETRSPADSGGGLVPLNSSKMQRQMGHSPPRHRPISNGSDVPSRTSASTVTQGSASLAYRAPASKNVKKVSGSSSKKTKTRKTVGQVASTLASASSASSTWRSNTLSLPQLPGGAVAGSGAGGAPTWTGRPFGTRGSALAPVSQPRGYPG